MFARQKISGGRTREREDRQRERKSGDDPKTDTSSAINKGKPEIVTLDKTV